MVAFFSAMLQAKIVQPLFSADLIRYFGLEIGSKSQSQPGTMS
jgi:hypothetical protein